MKYLKPLFAFLFLLFSISHAFYNGRNMPEKNFLFFETSHFKVIYEKGLDSLARRAAEVGEAAFPSLCEDLLVVDRDLPKINMILTDIDDESNGFSSFIGPTIELFAYPMLAVTTGNLAWIDRVVVHELAHQITYFAVRRFLGPYSIAYYTYFLPTWFVEGIAQFEGETWDKNREFLLKSTYNKFQFLDREHLYGFIGTDYIGSRLLYEEGHSLYRFLVQNHGKNIGGRILKNLTLFHPTLDHALGKTVGIDENVLLYNWRLMLEKDYPVTGTGNRPGNYAREVNSVLGSDFAQVYSLKRVNEGFVFTGIERTDVFEKNLYSWFPGPGLKKLAGPEAGTFFSILPDGKRVCYSINERDGKSGALLKALYVSDFNGRKRSLNGLKGEDPCVLPDGRIVYVRHRSGFSQLYSSDLSGRYETRIDLPPNVVQVYRPLFANRRIYMSIIDIDGERKAASISPDGVGFAIEAEKKGADIRFPTVNAKGQLAYVSNEEGPFNVFTKDSNGIVKSVTADPYGVFCPDFDGSTDSLLITALKDDKDNFNLSVFSISLGDEKQIDTWNMDQTWKTARGFDCSGIVKDSTEGQVGGRSFPYNGLDHISPILVYPDFTIFQNIGLNAEFADPLEKHTLTIGLMTNISRYNSSFYNPDQLGFKLSYLNKVLYPDITLLYMNNSVMGRYQLVDGWQYIEKKKRDLFQCFASIPVNFPRSFTSNQNIFFGALYSKSQYRDSVFNSGYYSIYPFPGKNEIPVFLEWSISNITPFVESYAYPLDAFSLNTQIKVADEAWGSESYYRILDVEYKQSIEIFKTYQTLFYRVKAGTFLGLSNYSFDADPEIVPRGKAYEDFVNMERYLSFTTEYRIPLVRDVGLAAAGLYFQLLTLSPFVDAFAYNRHGVSFRGAQDNLKSAWTAGVIGRQQVYFMGKTVFNISLLFYYDPVKSDSYGYVFDYPFGSTYGYKLNITGETGF